MSRVILKLTLVNYRNDLYQLHACETQFPYLDYSTSSMSWDFQNHTLEFFVLKVCLSVACDIKINTRESQKKFQ